MKARRNRDFDWRRPLLPKTERCEVVTPPPPPPSPVLGDSIMVEDIVFIPQASRLEFTVSWEAPIVLNGNLSFYELCLGEEAVSVEENNCTSPSTSLCVTTPEAATMDDDCTPLELGPSGLPTMDIEYLIDTNTSEVQVQVRVKCDDFK